MALLLACSGRTTSAVSSRYLFLIDTSFSMTRIDTPMRQAVGEIVRAGLGGRMQTGATFGLWTFNEQTHTDFPLQTWDGDGLHKDVLAVLVETHLKSARFEKTARFDRIWPEVAVVLESAGDVTVFLFSDGDAPLQGTPFDAEINTVWEKITGWLVNSPTERFALPEIPAPKIAAVVPPPEVKMPAVPPPAPAPVVEAPKEVVVAKPVEAAPSEAVVLQPDPPAPVAILALIKPVVNENLPVTEKPVEIKAVVEKPRAEVNLPTPVVEAAVVAPAIQTNAPAPTLAAIVPLPEAHFSSRGMFVIGGGMIFVLMLGRSRPPQPSLISRSMNQK